MGQIRTYQTKAKKLPGTNYAEVYKKAFNLYLKIKQQSKRRTYIRSVYFNKEKIFLSLFWQHLGDKHHKDRIRRIKYFPCAIEVICKSPFKPVSKENKNNKQKYLISVFPNK